MKLSFEVVKVVGEGNYPDVVHFANTQAQTIYAKDGKLYALTTDKIDYGEWEYAEFENEIDISPDILISNMEIKVVPGWGAILSYLTGNSHRMLIYEFYAKGHRNYVTYQEYIEVKSQDGGIEAYLLARDGVKDPTVDVRLNGESTLEFAIPSDAEKLKYITPESELEVGGRAYMLRKDNAIDLIRDDRNRLMAKVMAVERWKELEYSYIEPSISNDPGAKPPADLAVIIVGGGTNLSDNRFEVGTAAHALYAILKGSEWSLGVCDVEGIRDLESEKSDRLALIKQAQNIWGGYLTWDSVNRIVSLRDARKWQPYTGYQMRYRKNLKHITRTQSNRIVTKLYPFGHDDLDIALVNDGEKYITNHSYTNREYVGIYKNQDIYDQEELLEKAYAELELNCRPRYLYKIKAADTRALPEFVHEDFFVGDMVDIIDPDVAPDSPRPRLIRHKYNVFRPWQCELDVGDPQERLEEQLKASFNTTNFIDNKFTGDGKFSGHSLEDMTVVTDKIDNLAITTEKIDNLAITGAKIQELAIVNSHIDNLTITGGKIANATISNAKIIDLEADKITAGTIEVAIELKAAKITSSSTITGVVIRTDVETTRRIELTTYGLTSYSDSTTRHGFSLDSYGALNLYNSNNLVGTMVYDTTGAGTPEEAKNRMFIATKSGYGMKIESCVDLSIEAWGTTWMIGDVRFPDARDVRIGSKTLERYVEDIADDVARGLI